MLPEERRQRILQIIADKGSVSVADLYRRFGVSEMTIRRDLRLLGNKGLLLRVHGGALSGRSRSFEPPFWSRASKKQAEKDRIGKCAAALVQAGDSVAVGVGTTAMEVARHLRDKTDLTVITPSLRVASLLADQPHVRVIITGGILRRSERSLIGEIPIQVLRSFNVDKAFIGVSGISEEKGLTDYNLEDAQIQKALLYSAKERIVVTDASKFGRVAFATIASLNEIDRIVSDKVPDTKFLTVLKGLGIEVIIS